MFHRCALGQEVQLPDQYASGGGRAERFLAAADMRVLDESAAADPTNELSPIENIYRGSRLSKVVWRAEYADIDKVIEGLELAKDYANAASSIR